MPSPTRAHDYDSTRESWNLATRNHNAHKGDQAAFLRSGGDTLFPEELALLGELAGRSLIHLQCNAGQDSLCLARRGALVTGVDLSDEAIAFARTLALDSGIAAHFERAEVVSWLHETPARFELAFASYGTVGWLPDLDAWARGVARVLVSGGKLVLLEFHPVLWSVGKTLRIDGDDYFATEPFRDPVRDYVADSGAGLGAVSPGNTVENTVPAYSWQHTIADLVTAMARAGLVLETLHEYPYSNGCRVHASLVPAEGRRWVWPEGLARVPLMAGFVARKPGR